jgi:hypothetical protein
MRDLKQFMELFRPLPGNRYIQVTTEIDATTEALAKLLEGVGGELRLALYYDAYVPEIAPEFAHAKIEKIANFVHPFRALPREHDKVILKDIYAAHHKKESLLKTSYTTLANTAEIVIMEKQGVLNLEELHEALLACEYRAPNTVDVLEGYDIVVAKKMHMWGNGL